jgi:phage terminase large subunit-like protein
MVAHTFKTVDPTVPLKAVHASRGKQARAEPIAALYEQGRVAHVGPFAKLEDQLTTYVPGNASPDRMDALVWALTELMLNARPAFEIL